MKQDTLALGEYYLGRLCKRAHNWQDSGQSLRNRKGDCLECVKARNRSNYCGKRTYDYRRLTIIEKAKIINKFKSGETVYKTASEFNVTTTCIYELLNKDGTRKFTGKNPVEKKYVLNDAFFDFIDTELKAYWLGFLAADGCVSSDQKFVSVGLSQKDEDHLRLFLEAVDSSHPISHKMVKTYPVCLIKLYSPKMASALISHGVTPRKSLTLKYPSHLPYFLQRHFIRGYFDGDGCWYAREHVNRIKFGVISNPSFAEDLQQILIDACNLSKTKFEPHGKAVGVVYGGGKQCKRIYDFLYSDSTIYLTRKFKIVHDYLEKHS